jgi:DNA-binding transcriptional ArsR family regulator
VKPDTLKHEALTERDLLLSSLSEETKMALLKLGKRTRPEIMKDLIREICSQSEFTIDELCIILEKKSRSTFYYKYISELVKEKKLIKTNPEKPTYPNQKYRTVLSQSDRSQKENLK